MSDPFDPKDPVTDEERNAWKALVARLRKERDEAEAHAAALLAELGRREVSDFHIAQMVELGLETRGVIYMQVVLNELKKAPWLRGQQ